MVQRDNTEEGCNLFSHIYFQFLPLILLAVAVIVLNNGSYVRNKLQIWQTSYVPYTVKYPFQALLGGLGQWI
jgi:hypothetical protein